MTFVCHDKWLGDKSSEQTWLLVVQRGYVLVWNCNCVDKYTNVVNLNVQELSWRSREKLQFYCWRNLKLEILIANSLSFGFCCVTQPFFFPPFCHAHILTVVWVDRFRHVCWGLFTCRQMDYSDCTICGVDMLTSSSTRSLGVYPQVLRIYRERYLTGTHTNTQNLFIN